MSEQIGAAAGLVWQYLSANGAATASQIQKGIKADAALTNQAIGWLAREEKLCIDRSKKAALFALKQ